MSENQNPRIGIYYLGGVCVLSVAAFWTRPFGYVLLWPALSLLVIACGYFSLGARVYGKAHGQHTFTARCLHWFTRRGHEVSRRYYARQCQPWNELVPGLLIGRQLGSRETGPLLAQNVTAVLDLTAEFSEPPPLRKIHYLNIPLLDLTAPSDAQLTTALDFIVREIQRGTVYLHCKIGYSRTAAVAGCYLLRVGHAADAEEAMQILRRARPSIVIRAEARATLQRFQHFSQQCPPS